MIEPLAFDQGQHLNVTVDPTLPPILLGDCDRLKQIIFNLVDNAIKFTPEDGTIAMAD
jgi:signal transduction histidine kinase